MSRAASVLHRMTGTKRSWLPEPDPDDAELSAKRRRNDQRHEHRWGSIIDRYNRDFDGVGDEIDLRTGEIVVNRGHLSRMRDEFDNGDGPSSSRPSISDLLGQLGDDDESGGVTDASESVDEDEHDELSSHWPISSPNLQRPPSPPARPKSESVTPEEQYEDAEEVLESRDTPAESAGQDHPRDEQEVQPIMHAAPAQGPVPTLPQFQIPQMGFGGQLEGAMAAMSTAMGAAIQAQMMAFMNVVLAAQQGTIAAPAAGSAELPNVPLSMPPSPAHAAIKPATQGPTKLPRSGISRNVCDDLTSVPERRLRKLPPSDKAIRAQTPGFGSLWAPLGRSRKDASRPPKIPKVANTAAAETELQRLTSLDIAAGIQSEAEADEDDIEAISRPGADPEILDGHELDDQFEVPGEQSPASARFILDSDDDELAISTPPSTQGLRPRNTHSAAKSHKLKPVVEIFTASPISLTAHSVTRRPIAGYDRMSESRRGLRNRNAAVNYNDQAVFDGLLEGLDRVEPEPLTGFAKPTSCYQEKTELFESDYSSGDELSQLVDYEAPPAMQSAVTKSGTAQSHAQAANATYVYKPRPHLHKKHVIQAVATDASVMLQGPLHAAANTSKPRQKRKTYARITAFQLYNSLTDDQMKAREEAWADVKYRKLQRLSYDDRPPPLPCSHCKATTATSWKKTANGGHRKECNACISYPKRNNGEKRPLNLEDARSRTTKRPCENCGHVSVADWNKTIDDRLLCVSCYRYAKANSGEMRPFKRSKPADCDRCGETVNKTYLVSNRASVCLGCHNELFADYDPANDAEGPPLEAVKVDPGELFYDRCLLIYTKNFLAGHGPVKYANDRIKRMPNARGAPCKSCHSLAAAGWRPALDSMPMCELCYVRTRKMIETLDLVRFMGNQGQWDVEGLQTEDYECVQCEEKLVDGKWHGDEEKGVVFCRGCYRDKHGKHRVAAETLELESPGTARSGGQKSRESIAFTEDSVIAGPSEH